MERGISGPERVENLLEVVKIDALEAEAFEDEGFSRCVDGRGGLCHLVNRTVQACLFLS